MKILPFLVFAVLSVCVMRAQPESGVHEGRYQKNLTYKGPVTGDEIIYTLYLPPGHAKDKGPYPLIVFLHGAGGGNASSQVMQSYEAARKAGKIGNFVVVFPEKYGGTVWRDGAKDKRPETNVLKELLPHLEKEHALSRDRGARTIMGFSMGAAGSIYWGPSTSTSSRRQWLWTREGAPVSPIHRPAITCLNTERKPRPSRNLSSCDWCRGDLTPGSFGIPSTN